MTDAVRAPAADRFVQMAYTSGQTGFGIHSAIGAPTQAESDVIVSGADPSRADFGQPLPRFAAPEEVARFNRNLVAYPVAPGELAIWHTAPAGADESGRTGNVFVHAILDRDAGTDAVRAVDRWRSPGWVTPFGAAEVRASALPELAPGPGPAVGGRQVCDFLLDPTTWRLAVLSRLLEELALPRGARGPVVLGVDSPDDGALWVGAVAHLMSPGSAAQMGFGVWETPRALQPERIGRFDLVCMSPRDLAEVRERFPQVTAFATSDDLAPRDWSPGDERGELAWGALALGMLSLADDPVEVLDEIDAIAARVGDRALARYWPLAMAMAGRMDAWDFLSHPIAAALRAGSPPELAVCPDLLDSTAELVGRHTGSTTGESWAALNECAPGPIAHVLQRIYLGRALADDAWLLQEGGAPARRDPGWNPAADPALATGLTRAIERAAALSDPITRAVAAVSLTDLIIRTGWPSHDPDALAVGRLLPFLAGALRPVLADTSAREVFTAGCQPDGDTLVVIRAALADWPLDIGAAAGIGRRLPVAVLAWLYPEGPAAGPIPESLSLLDVEALALAATGARDPELRQKGRERLLTEAIQLHEEQFAQERADLIAVVDQSNPLVASELRLLRANGYRPTDSQLAGAIVRGLPGEADDVFALLTEASAQGDRAAIDRALRWLPMVRSGQAWGAPTFDVAARTYAPNTIAALSELCRTARSPVGPLWAAHLACAVELADVRSGEHGFLASMMPPPGTLAPGLDELCAAVLELPMTDVQWCFDRIDQITLRAVLSDPDFPRPITSSPATLAHRLADEDGRPAVVAGLESFYAGMVKEDLVGTRDALLGLVQESFPDDPEVADFARSWFATTSGSKGMGDRLRHAGGRLFGKSSPTASV